MGNHIQASVFKHFIHCIWNQLCFIFLKTFMPFVSGGCCTFGSLQQNIRNYSGIPSENWMTFLQSMSSSNSSPSLQTFFQCKIRKNKRYFFQKELYVVCFALSSWFGHSHMCRFSVDSPRNKARNIVKNIIYTSAQLFCTISFCQLCVSLLQGCHMLPTVKVRDPCWTQRLQKVCVLCVQVLSI